MLGGRRRDWSAREGAPGACTWLSKNHAAPNAAAAHEKRGHAPEGSMRLPMRYCGAPKGNEGRGRSAASIGCRERRAGSSRVASCQLHKPVRFRMKRGHPLLVSKWRPGSSPRNRRHSQRYRYVPATCGADGSCVRVARGWTLRDSNMAMTAAGDMAASIIGLISVAPISGQCRRTGCRPGQDATGACKSRLSSGP